VGPSPINETLTDPQLYLLLIPSPFTMDISAVIRRKAPAGWHDTIFIQMASNMRLHYRWWECRTRRERRRWGCTQWDHCIWKWQNYAMLGSKNIATRKSKFFI